MGPNTLLAEQDHVEALVSTLFNFIEAQGHTGYTGESISQLEHSLQAVHLAEHSGAGRDTILGALFHIIGHFIPAADSDASYHSAKRCVRRPRSPRDRWREVSAGPGLQRGDMSTRESSCRRQALSDSCGLEVL